METAGVSENLAFKKISKKITGYRSRSVVKRTNCISDSL